MAGRPDLNTMNTALNMGGFDVVNAANVYSNGLVQANGNIVSTNGVVMSQVDDPAYGQTELRRWGLHNPTGTIYIEPMAGNGVVIMPSGGGTSGSFISALSNNEFRRGHTQFSRDNGTYCCGDPATIGVAEATSSTGRTASINFHNGGVSEASLELANDSTYRRLRVFGNQGVRVGLAADRLWSYDYTSTSGETYTGGWFRTTGNCGWYSEPWGGGWFMQDGTWVRSYNDKNVYTGGEVQAGRLTSNSYTGNNNGYFYNTANDWSLVGYAAGGNLNANPTWSWGSINVNDIYLRSAYGGSGQWLSQALGPVFKTANIPIGGGDGGYNLSSYLPWPDQANVTAIQVTMTNYMSWGGGVGPFGHVYVDGIEMWSFGFDTTSGNENLRGTTTFMLTPGWHNVTSWIENGVWSTRSMVITGYFTR